jgi:rhodanese-related sulfurtransferase
MGKTYEDYVREALALVTEVTPEEARRLHETDGPPTLFLDVREPNEVAKGAIEGALVIPRGRLEDDAPDWIFEPESLFVVYCNSGKRSALAVKTLLEMGFTGARSLRGGLDAWKAAGAPLGEPRAT